jgi:signal transduction histidine kinase
MTLLTPRSNLALIAALRGEWNGRMVGVLVLAMCASVAGLAWFGFHAMREWRHSSAQLIRRLADDHADLLATALRRDMRGVQTLVLASRDSADYASQPTPDFSDEVAAAFARYPYPESFFGWRNDDPDGLVFFNRANREPAWSQGTPVAARYPVVVQRGEPTARELLDAIRRVAALGRTYAVFDTELAGQSYQVVARLQYRDLFRRELDSITGFTVNLAWVRHGYFAQLTSEVARIGEAGTRLEYGISDEAGQPVIGVPKLGDAAVREFRLEFFDPSISQVESDSGARHPWHIRVSAAADPTLIWATREGDWITVMIAAMSLALALSVLIVAHAARCSASLAAMRADFVSTVTHELKTPLAGIRAIGDTLVRGALGAQGVREYAGLLVHESRRLTRLLDNLLAYSRISDVTQAYTFERLDPAALIDDSIGAFRRQLTDRQFSLDVSADQRLPPVRGDRTALQFALDNLIDNAIHYSGDRRWLGVTARCAANQIVFEVSDHGAGIPADEIEAVQRRFVRGTRAARTKGTGLGLAIVKRIAADHGGQFELQSHVGVGTVARLRIPVSPA